MLASVHEVDVHEVDTARSANKASSSLEVGLLRARAQTKVDEGFLRILPSLRRQSSRKPYNISENHTNSKKIT